MARRRRAFLGAALLVGGAAVAVSAFFVEGLIACADPGGCVETRQVSAILAFGVLLFGVGIAFLMTPIPRVFHVI